MPIISYSTIIDTRPDIFDRRAKRYSVDELRKQLKFLMKHYEMVGLEAYMRVAGNCEEPQSKVAVVFDANHKGVFDYAYPTLAGLGIQATVFVRSSHIGGQMGSMLEEDILEIAFRETKSKQYISDALDGLCFPIDCDISAASTWEAVKCRVIASPSEERSRQVRKILDQLKIPSSCLRKSKQMKRYSFMTESQLSQLREAGWSVATSSKTWAKRPGENLSVAMKSLIGSDGGLIFVRSPGNSPQEEFNKVNLPGFFGASSTQFRAGALKHEACEMRKTRILRRLSFEHLEAVTQVAI